MHLRVISGVSFSKSFFSHKGRYHGDLTGLHYERCKWWKSRSLMISGCLKTSVRMKVLYKGGENGEREEE